MKRTVSLIFAILMLLSLVACGKSAEAKWQEQYDLGVRYLAEGNYEEAIIAFTAAIEIDPKREEAYVALADVYYATGDTAKAEEILAQRPTQETDSQTIVRTERYDHDGGSYTIYEYDASGHLSRETSYNSDGTVDCIFEYEYTENTPDVVVRYTDLSVEFAALSCEVFYIMQNEDNHVFVTRYGYDSTIYIGEIDEYDASRHLVRETYYNTDGTVEFVEEYDASGNPVLLTKYTTEGKIEETYEYDSSGKMIKDTMYNADGRVNQYSVFEYDAAGENVRSITYNADGTVFSVWERE